jgi:hypothetical protein
VSGLVIHAVVRNRKSEAALDALQDRAVEPDYSTVSSGDLTAIVTEELNAPGSQAAVSAHGRIVARLIRRSSVVPVPAGLQARDEAAVIAFLERQRIPLLEALDFLEDGYELRLHLAARGPGETEDRLRAVAHHVYEQLQRQAKAARILEEGGRERILSAAFLIPRNEWIRFVEQIADWEGRFPTVRMDVTGPWAAWDFVHVMGVTDALESNGEVS